MCLKEKKDSRHLSVLHVSYCSCEAPTSDDHNFLVRSPFQVFLDSKESSLSLESDHIHVDGIWGSNISVPTSSVRDDVRPEKFQFLEKGQNRNFGYEIVISVKNPKFIL